MKKPSIASSMSSKIGLLLGVIGLFFIVYSLYILFFLPLKEDLINILPSDNFEFILITDDKNFNIPEDIKNQLPFPIPEEGAIVSYKESLDFIFITPESYKKKLKSQTCKTSNGYNFCTASENSVMLYQIIEAMEKKEQSLINLPFLGENTSFFSDENNISFAGTTSFLESNIEKIPLVTGKEKKFIKKSLQISSDSIPYFSGKISIKQKKYEISFHKKNGNKTLIFPKSINNKIIPSSYIYPKISSYIYIRKPKFFLDFIRKNAEEKSLPKTISLYNTWKKWVSSFFSHKALWDEDIEPLLATDIIFMKSKEGNGIISLLPNETINKKFYEKFYEILHKISSEKVAERQGVQLKDGTMVYEIFPSEKNVEIISNKQEKKTGISDDMEFTFFITQNPSSEKKEISAIAKKDNALIIADNKVFIENIKKRKNGKKNVSAPLKKEIFFSLGILNEEMKENNSPITHMEIIGKETENTLTFSGKIKWNHSFFITEPLKKNIETDEKTINDKRK